MAANDTVASTPTRLTRDYVYFNDEWSRETDLVGRLVWQSDVLVDGANRTMQFQVQGAERFAMFHERVAFAGFSILGAFIYPAGAVIFHDPSLEAISDLWNLPTALNLTPFTVLAIQLVIAGFAVGAAVVLRTRGRRAS